MDKELAPVLELIAAGHAHNDRLEWEAAYKMFAASLAEDIRKFHGPKLAEAIAEHKTSPLVEKRQDELFALFKVEMLKQSLPFLPALPEAVCGYLMGLGVNGKSAAEVKRHAAALQAVHHLCGYNIDPVYITTALKVVSGFGDPGGGKPVETNRAAPHSFEPVSMAAAPAGAVFRIV
jgi:hypothetical protein